MTAQTLSHYRVLDKLGEGTSAVVYLAEDLVLGRPVVLKLLPPSGPKEPGDSERFLHEARTVSSLNHPNICTIYEIAEDGGRQFLVMELLDGQALSELVAGGPLPILPLVDMAIQIADGLDAAHLQGIVHRDIKPPNLFVTRRGQAKILDFGIAVPTRRRFHERDRDPQAAAPRASKWGGTLPYMSPEQLRGEELDARSDLFSLGCVLYEMAAGRRPFVGEDATAVAAAILSETPPLLADLNPAVPPELERIIHKTLEKSRQLRCQTAADLRADLQRLKRDLEATDSTAGESQAPGTPPAGGNRWLWFAAAAAALVAAATAGLALVDAPAVRGPVASAAPVAAPTPARSELPPPASIPAPEPAAVPPAGAARRSGPPAPEPANSPPARAAVALPAPPTRSRRGPDITPPPAAGPSDVAASAGGSALEQELRIARAQVDHKLYDQALATLHDAVANQSPSPAAVEAYFLMASIQETQQKPEDAMATYLQIADRFQSDARAPEALFRLAQMTRRSRRSDRDVDARRVLETLIVRYPDDPWVVRALMAKAELEEQQGLSVEDATMGGPVPAALVSYRRVTERQGSHAEREPALWKLGQLYERVKRYDLAAEAYATLGERYPGTRYDAWAEAARIYDRRLKDPALARAAYARVPPASPSYRDAQKHAGRP